MPVPTRCARCAHRPGAIANAGGEGPGRTSGPRPAFGDKTTSHWSRFHRKVVYSSTQPRSLRMNGAASCLSVQDDKRSPTAGSEICSWLWRSMSAR